MGVILKIEKEKNGEGVPEQGMHLGKCHGQHPHKFTFPPCKHSISKDGNVSLLQAEVVMCVSWGDHKNKHLLLLKQNLKGKSTNTTPSPHQYFKTSLELQNSWTYQTWLYCKEVQKHY